jgi:hypothetical protein
MGDLIFQIFFSIEALSTSLLKNYAAAFYHPNWAVLLPWKICRNLGFMIQAYRGYLGYQRKIWKPVQKKVANWYKICIKTVRWPEPRPYFKLA